MTRTRIGALLLALTTILWLTAATPALAHHKDGHGQGQSSSDDGGTKDNASGKNGQPDPEPVHDDEQASKGKGNCENANAGKEGGDYESTCNNTVGRHGGNGNGKCAGCDGRADNKNPPGQSKNDHNNGYECDNNKGVAKGNPAHSRCQAKPDSPPEPPKTCPDGSPMPPSGKCDKPGNPPNPIDIPAPSLPDERENVLGLRFRGVPPVPAQVEGRRQRPSVLPFTGAGAAMSGFALIGLGLMAAGGLMIRPRRKGKHEG